MSPEQTSVRQFMAAFGQDTPIRPTIPSAEIRKLRAKLILEEALETIKALGFQVCFVDKTKGEVYPEDTNIAFLDDFKPNLVEIADGLADLHYVGYCGTGVACGLNMEIGFAEIHRSNMSKFWTSMEVAAYFGRDAQELHQQTNPDITFSNDDGLIARKVEKHRWIVKDKDGKVIKSPSYSPPDLKTKMLL